jgi:hypothetical protein
MVAHVGQQRYKEALAAFIKAYRDNQPWYFPIQRVVATDDATATFIKTLGLSNKAGVAFLKAAGLITIRLYKGKAVLRMEHDQWRVFVTEEGMSQYCDYNQAYVNMREHSFINLGNKSVGTYFAPAKQYRVKPTQPSFRLSVPQRQLKAKLRCLAVFFNTSDHTEYDRDLSFAASDRACPNYYNSDSSSEEEDEEDSDEEDIDDGDGDAARAAGAADEEPFDFGYTYTPINLKDHPVLSKLTGGKDTVDSGTVNALIWELLSLPQTNNRATAFEFANETKGCMVNVPSHGSERAFVALAGRAGSKWIDAVLSQIFSDSKEDAAQWLCTYLGKQFEDAFKTAATELGFPSVVRMDPYDAIAMFDDANVTISQMRTIKQYLRRCFGNKLFIPDYKIRDDVARNLTMPNYGTMQYMSQKAKEEKKRPEAIDFWCHDVVKQMCDEIECEVNKKGASHGLNPYETHRGRGWTITVGADHGKGAWRCHTKINTHSPAHQRRFQNLSRFEKRTGHGDCGFRVANTANITCKKDHPDVIRNTVAKKLDDGYATIKNSQLVVIWNSKEEKSVANVMPKLWGAVRLENKDGSAILTSQSGGSIIHLNMPFDDCEVTLRIPQLTLLVVGDLAFFADAVGKHGTCGWWCLYCQLKHPEWQTCDHTQPGKLWTDKETEEVRARVAERDDLPPDVRMGIMGPPLFPSISQDDLVPPMLHGQMGFTNAVVTFYVNWIDDKVQKVGDGEKATRLAALGATADLQLKIEKRDDMMNEMSAVLKQYKIDLKLHKKKGKEAEADLKKAKDHETRSSKDGEIEHHRLQEILTEEEINDIEKKLVDVKESVRTARKLKQSCKDSLKKHKDARGRPTESIIAQFEKVLRKYNAKREAYHGGDFNGVSCRKLVANIVEIMLEFHVIIMQEKDASCSDDEANKMCNGFLAVCGLIDAAFSALLVIDPTGSEILDAENKVKKLMKEWRGQGMSVTLKAHIFEHHVIAKMRELGGLGDKDESFVELLHQDGARNERRLNCVASYEAKHNSILKTVRLGTLPEVMKKKVEHANKVKRKRKEAPVIKTKPDENVKKTRLGVAKHEATRKDAKEERTVKRERFLAGDITMESLDSKKGKK